MNRRIWLVFVIGIILVLLTGCGSDKADYDELEKRISRIEKELGITEENNSQKHISETTIQVTQAERQSEEENHCYNLSELSVDGIIDELGKILFLDMQDKKPEEVVKNLYLRVKPKNEPTFSTDYGEKLKFDENYKSNQYDMLISVGYSFSRNMDGTCSKQKSASAQIIIRDYNRAAELYDKLCNKYCSGGYNDKSNGTHWQAQINRGNRYRNINMYRQEDSVYLFELQISVD